MRKFLITFMSIAVLLASVGCSRDENTVSTDGSTSMEKVIGALGEAFEIKNNDMKFTYNPTGSGAGIAAVLEGRCDIGLSSRELKESEASKGLVTADLAYDGIAIIVNKENNIVSLDSAVLSQIYKGEIKDWKEIGGKDGEIVLIGREAGSGTRDGFESVLDVKDKCRYRQELTSAGDVITAVSGNPLAIGYTSLASVKNSVKTVKIDGVLPSEKTIKSGEYKIKRPFILVTAQKTEIPQRVKKFLEFVFSDEAKKIITAAGVIPAG